MMVDDRKNHRIGSADPQSYSDGGDPFETYEPPRGKTNNVVSEQV